jgi:hypothetical protein
MNNYVYQFNYNLATNSAVLVAKTSKVVFDFLGLTFHKKESHEVAFFDHVLGSTLMLITVPEEEVYEHLGPAVNFAPSLDLLARRYGHTLTQIALTAETSVTAREILSPEEFGEILFKIRNATH